MVSPHFFGEVGSRILKSILVLLGMCSAGFAGHDTPVLCSLRLSARCVHFVCRSALGRTSRSFSDPEIDVEIWTLLLQAHGDLTSTTTTITTTTTTTTP